MGKTIGNYEIIEELGRGTFTRSYKVRDTKLNRICVMRILEKDAFPAEVYENARKRFNDEAISVAKLHHGSIIKIFDYGECDDGPYIITEYAEGGSLAQRMGQPLPEEEAASLMSAIADALSYANSHGIVHGDIKPSNILFRRDGSPFLTDFGVADMLGERDESGRTLAETGMNTGSAAYTAPEQSRGEQTGEQADQYSLGVIFYELLTGHKPFSGENPMEILLKQQSGSFRDPKQDRISLSDKTMQVLNRSLAAAPEERYDTISDFSTVLQGISAMKSREKKKKPAGPKLVTAVLAVILLFAAAVFGLFRSGLIPGGNPAPTAPLPSETAADVLQSVPTETAFPTETETILPAAADTLMPTLTCTQTETAVPTETDTPTPTDTVTPTATDTHTPTATDTHTPTATETETPTPTDTATYTPTATDTFTPTATDTLTPTATDTLTPTATDTSTPTATETDTPTPTATSTPTAAATNTPTPTATATATEIPTATPVSYSIGYGSSFYTLDDFWRGLPENSGPVRLLLDNTKQLDGFISIPEDKGITELILDAEGRHTVVCSGTRLYANGIPLTVGKNLNLAGMTIFGGTYAVGNTDRTVETASVTLYGSAGNVYAGGEVRGEGSYQGSSTVGSAKTAIYGIVTGNVYGGGCAAGEGSVSHVEESSLYLDKWGKVGGTLYYGGRAGSVCPGGGDSCGLDHGTVTLGSVEADIRGEVQRGVNRGSYSSPASETGLSVVYAPYFDFSETEASQDQEEAPEPVWQEMLLAWGQECADLTCAMTKIAPETTDLLLKIGYNFNENYSVTLPNEGNALRQVTIDADTPVTVNMQNLSIYANGVKLTIGANVTLQNSVIYAGGKSDSGRNHKESAELVIAGTVGSVYAGGGVGCPGCSAGVGESTVTISGYVMNSVYGGGYAVEKDARAENGTTTLILTKTSRIRQNLYLGGQAVNYCDPLKRGTPEECDHAGTVSVGTVKAAVYGEVTGDIIESGVGTEGALSTIGELIYIEAPETEMMDRSDPQILRVGDYEAHRTLQHALQSIRYPGGDVTIELCGKAVSAADVVIPDNKALRSIRFVSDRENAVRTIDLGGRMLFANGIPLTVGKDITIINGQVLAGGKSAAGRTEIREASLTIEGTIQNNVYGGGAANCISSLSESCSSDVGDSQILISGTVQGNVYLGGYTLGGGSKAALSGTSRLTMTNSALVRGNLYFGGNAQSGRNAELSDYCEYNKLQMGICSPDNLKTAVTVNRAEAALYGTVLGTVFRSGQNGPEGALSVLNEYAFVETDPAVMNLSDPQEIRIGPGETIGTLPQALENIRYSENGADVILVLTGNQYLSDNIELPSEKNIRSLLIMTDRPGANRTVDLADKSLFACGIPLTVGENIFLTNANVYAGCLLQVETEEDAVQDPRKSVSADGAKVTVLGTVGNLYAGGRAAGSGIESLVSRCELDIQGTVQRNVYGGGTAINSGHTAVSETLIRLGPEAKVNANIYCGGYAEITKEKGIYEADSLSEVGTVTIIDEGDFDPEHIFPHGLNGAGGVSTVEKIKSNK